MVNHSQKIMKLGPTHTLHSTQGFLVWKLKTATNIMVNADVYNITSVCVCVCVKYFCLSLAHPTAIFSHTFLISFEKGNLEGMVVLRVWKKRK